MHGSVSYCFGPDGEESPMTTLTAPISTSATPASVAAATTSEAQTTAVTDCHLHATEVFCVAGNGEEVQVEITGTPTGELPAQYTDCHSHGSEQYCVDPDGNDVAILAAGEHSEDSHDDSASDAEMNCHFHAGVE